MNKYLVIGVLLLSITACQQNDKKADARQQTDGLNLSFMDKTLRPQDDFYGFVNGEWMKKTEMPADRGRWGSFDALAKKTDLNTLKILKEVAKSNQYKKGTDQRKAIDYFASITDTISRNEAGITPVKIYLDKINNIKTKNDVVDFMIFSEPILNSAFIGVGVGADMKDSNKNTLYVSPAGLGLPERDYYVSDKSDAVKIRAQYKEHIGKMLQFIGRKQAEIDNAKKNILSIETALASAKLTKEERRNPAKRYNPMNMAELIRLMPDFDTKKYFSDLGYSVDDVIVSQPKYLKAFNEIFKEFDVNAVKDFLIWNLFRGAAGKLSTKIANTNWDFYGKILNGQKERRPLNERALSSVNWTIGEAVGKLYVDKMFPPEAKANAKEMIVNLQKAYKQRIKNLSWMSAETKQKAIEKVDRLQVKIGYPDKWKDYSKMQIKSPNDGGTYFTNSLNVSKWHFEEGLDKLNKPVDKTEWGMAPQIVNAYYNQAFNEIVFPAAILQAPFYDYHRDAALNYGGMGAVIGHEISHGFDDQGAKYNADGNYENWWTKADFEAFSKLVERLADQYSKIEVLPEVFVNGTFTSGENIGDLGGVNAAFTALEIYYKDHKKPGKIQGFTPEQRFYMSWATVWRTKARDAYVKKQIKTNPHSPGQVRAVQSLKNVDAFYKAFEVKEGDGMYIKPEARVKIW